MSSSLSASTICTSCPTGTYSGENDDTNCFGSCSAGKYSDETGLSSDAQCKDCSLGKYSDQTGLGSDNDCKACPVGQHSNQTGVTHCQACTVTGYVCPEQSINPTVCVAGTYSDQPSVSSTCKVCMFGQYQDEKAQDKCKECSVGKFLADPGSFNLYHTSEFSCQTCLGSSCKYIRCIDGGSVCLNHMSQVIRTILV
jgi:hypothetical protein